MQRGPGVIVEALNEIDALISNPPPLARRTDHGRRGRRGATSINEIVREYDLSLETGLPLSRTTDSWGDDPEEELTLREETVHSPPRNSEHRPSTSSELSRLRRGEHPSELNRIRESRFSSISSVENSNQLYRINEECDTSVSSVHTRETVPSSGERHPAEASDEKEHEVFNSRHRVERESTGSSRSNNLSLHRNGAMQPSERHSNQNEGNGTPRKENGGVHFCDSGHEFDKDGRTENLNMGPASPVKKTQREERWGADGRFEREPASVPQKAAKQTRSSETSQTSSSRQTYNNEFEVAKSVRSRDETSQRILLHKTVCCCCCYG